MPIVLFIFPTESAKGRKVYPQPTLLAGKSKCAMYVHTFSAS